jgi:hypothetical protein
MLFVSAFCPSRSPVSDTARARNRASSALATYVDGINDKGQIVGLYYVDATTSRRHRRHERTEGTGSARQLHGANVVQRLIAGTAQLAPQRLLDIQRPRGRSNRGGGQLRHSFVRNVRLQADLGDVRLTHVFEWHWPCSNLRGLPCRAPPCDGPANWFQRCEVVDMFPA